MTLKALYKAHEVVKITSSQSSLSKINGQEAIILYLQETTEGWVYTLQILDTSKEYDILENELQTTGQILEPLYAFYEVVIIHSTQSNLSHLNGKEAAILGRARAKEYWSYAVSILTTGICWCIDEDELQPTGRKMAYEDFYTGESVIVEVDPKTGRGKIKT